MTPSQTPIRSGPVLVRFDDLGWVSDDRIWIHLTFWSWFGIVWYIVVPVEKAERSADVFVHVFYGIRLTEHRRQTPGHKVPLAKDGG